MSTRLKIDLQNGFLEVDGEEKFVEKIYQDFKEQLKNRSVVPLIDNKPPFKMPFHATNLAEFETLADCFATINTKKIKLTDSLNVLVAAAYLQAKNNLKHISGQEINKELKNIGRKVGNITNAIQADINEKPQRMMQLKKSGKSKQARKEYKVTTEGISFVTGLLRGEIAEANEEE